MEVLFHNNHTPEPDFAAHRMVESIVRFIKGELLNHALDFVELSEFNGLFAIERLAGRPAMNRSALSDHGIGIDFDFAHG